MKIEDFKQACLDGAFDSSHTNWLNDIFKDTDDLDEWCRNALCAERLDLVVLFKKCGLPLSDWAKKVLLVEEEEQSAAPQEDSEVPTTESMGESPSEESETLEECAEKTLEKRPSTADNDSFCQAGLMYTIIVCTCAALTFRLHLINAGRIDILEKALLETSANHTLPPAKEYIKYSCELATDPSMLILVVEEMDADFAQWLSNHPVTFEDIEVTVCNQWFADGVRQYESRVRLVDSWHDSVYNRHRKDWGNPSRANWMMHKYHAAIKHAVETYVATLSRKVDVAQDFLQVITTQGSAKAIPIVWMRENLYALNLHAGDVICHNNHGCQIMLAYDRDSDEAWISHPRDRNTIGYVEYFAESLKSGAWTVAQ